MTRCPTALACVVIARHHVVTFTTNALANLNLFISDWHEEANRIYLRIKMLTVQLLSKHRHRQLTTQHNLSFTNAVACLMMF
jgi:hypothetical protein